MATITEYRITYYYPNQQSTTEVANTLTDAEQKVVAKLNCENCTACIVTAQFDEATPNKMWTSLVNFRKDGDHIVSGDSF